MFEAHGRRPIQYPNPCCRHSKPTETEAEAATESAARAPAPKSTGKRAVAAPADPNQIFSFRARLATAVCREVLFF